MLFRSSSLPFNNLSYDPSYIDHLIKKLSFVKLIDTSTGEIEIEEAAEQWLSMPLDNQSLYFYRHPLNRLTNEKISSTICTEKSMREAEKSIIRVLDAGWVLFDEFFDGILAPLGPNSTVTLKKFGRNWRYTLPEYSEEESAFLRSVVLDWLFEAGIVQVGSFKGKECFRVTTLGKTLFAR